MEDEFRMLVNKLMKNPKYTRRTALQAATSQIRAKRIQERREKRGAIGHDN